MQLSRLLKRHDATLRPSHHRTRHVELGGGRRATGDDEGIGQRKSSLQAGDLRLEPLRELWRDHHEVRFELAVLGGISRQLGAYREKLALDPEDDGVTAAGLDMST